MWVGVHVHVHVQRTFSVWRVPWSHNNVFKRNIPNASAFFASNRHCILHKVAVSDDDVFGRMGKLPSSVVHPTLDGHCIIPWAQHTV